MGILKSGEVGNLGLKQLTEQRQLISNKWEKLGLLEGLKGHIKDNIAQLYENQASHMLSQLNESTDAAGASGAFETVAFPVIRRVFSKLLANDIVSVQALSLPIGKLFYLNPKVSNRVGTVGQSAHTSPDGAYSNAATAANPTTFENRSLYDAFYGNTDFYGTNEGIFDKSKGRITYRTGFVTGVTWTSGDRYVTGWVTGITATNQGTIIGPRGEVMDTEAFLAGLQVFYSGNTVATAYYTLTGSSTAGGAIVVPSGSTGGLKEGVTGTLSGGSLPYRVITQKYGTAIAGNPNGALRIEIDLSTPSSTGYAGLGVALNGSALAATTSGISLFFNYATYSSLEQDSEMAEVTFELSEVTVSVETRKMRAQWTPELAQDVAAFQNIDAEAELTALLSEQMAAEIDREILRDIRNGAAWSLRWDYNGLRNQSATYYGTQKDWNQTLITKVNQISAQIHKATLRGGASWIVVSPEISAVLDDLEYFHVSNASPEEDKYNMGIEKIGTLQGRYTVYRDPYAPANTCLIGHKGTSILESGYIYAPYVPMQLTPTMYNPFDFKPIKGIMTRYAKKLVNNRFYGKILVDGLTTFSMSELQ